jgi:serine/threonine protein phosphatase PrpC
MLLLEPFGVTDAGKIRRNNEDALLVGEGKDETLFAVADGIGGFEAGEVASRIAVDVLNELEPSSSFEEAIQEANRRILAAGRGDEKFSGMGTTVVAVRFGGTHEEPVAEVAHVGDSRAYLLRADDLRPVTEDHSLVAELVRSGDLTRAQAAEHPQKNLITRALGADEDVEVDTAVLAVEAGDRLLLCSDGLTDMVPEDLMFKIFTASPGDPEGTARGLVSAALDAGGTDNVTVVVVDVKEHAEPPREERSGTREMPAVAPSGPPSGPPSGSPSGSSSGSSPGDSAGHSEGRTSARRTPGRGRKGDARSSSKRPTVARRKRRPGRASRMLGRLVRSLAAILVVVVALTPAYLWGGSRYFFGFDDGEVVAYRGLPYAPLGVELNEEWRRTGVEEADVKGPYRDPIEDHKLYTREQAERVLGDLGN